MVMLASTSITVNVTAVLRWADFADNLDQDPPSVTVEANAAGVVTWDFHSSATPPAKGAGDIGAGTQAVLSGPNTLQINLSEFPGETGYLHFRLTVNGSDSAVLTSRQITTLAGFEPSSLFFDGAKGAFWDFTAAHCYTDTARTTLAEIGGAVAGVTDLSGRDNHLVQETLANRPLLQDDGAGNLRLSFDGTNDLLQRAAMDLDDTDELSMMLVYDFPSVADRQPFRVGSGANPFLAIRTASSTSARADGNGGSATSSAEAFPLPSATDRVHFAFMKINTSPLLRARADGVQASITTSLGSSANFGTGRTVSVGARDQFGGWADIRIYAALVINRLLTSEEITDLETWAQARSGITW